MSGPERPFIKVIVRETQIGLPVTYFEYRSVEVLHISDLRFFSRNSGRFPYP